MSKKLAIAMFGQKRLSREGGVEIVVKELCTRMAQNVINNNPNGLNINRWLRQQCTKKAPAHWWQVVCAGSAAYQAG